MALPFNEYLKSQNGITFTNDPVTVRQDVVTSGDKYARTYYASQEFLLTFSDLTKIQETIDKAVALGFDVGKVDFFLLDRTKYQSDLRIKAVALAKSDASDRAKQYGKQLNDIIRVNYQSIRI